MTYVINVLPSDVGHLSDLDPTSLAIVAFLARYRGNTYREYKTDLELYVNWCKDESVPILLAQRVHLEMYRRWLETHHWAESTVARRFGTICVFYNVAERDDAIPKSPARDVTRPEIDATKQKRTFLTPLEFAAFLAASRLESPTAHALTALLGMSGLRIAEACSTRIEHLHVEAGYDTLHLIGKGNKAAIVPLPTPVMRAIREATDGREYGPVLLSKWKTEMNRSAATRLIRRVADRAHINKDLSPHTLRRTFCTSGLVSGVSLRDMQIAMRHASPNTTARYDMATNSLDRHASHRVASYLAGMTG